MPMFFRAIQTEQDVWECRHGLTSFDEHTTLEEALEHLRVLAMARGAAELFAHWSDGRITREGTIDAET